MEEASTSPIPHSVLPPTQEYLPHALPQTPFLPGTLLPSAVRGSSVVSTEQCTGLPADTVYPQDSALVLFGTQCQAAAVVLKPSKIGLYGYLHIVGLLSIFSIGLLI